MPAKEEPPESTSKTYIHKYRLREEQRGFCGMFLDRAKQFNDAV